MQTKNLAIMFTDIKGYTERTSKQSHDKTSSLLKQHQGVVLPIIHAFHGRLIKTIGDAFLVVFGSPTEAVQCGMTIQDQLFKFNHGRPDAEQIHLRVAINVGEVLTTSGDVFGEAVNIASRIEGITPANEVYLSESVYLTMNRSEVNAEKVGDFTLKGIPEPVTVYRVPQTPAAQALLDSAGGSETAARAARRMTAPDLVTLPYGGKHLARIESMWLTPTLKRNLLIGGSAFLLVLILALTIPSYLRGRQWEQIEASIGRGKVAEAISRLQNIDPDNDDERRHFFALQVQVATRLLERREAEQLADLLLQITPADMQQTSIHGKLVAEDLDLLIAAKSLDYATRLLDSIPPRNDAEKRSMLVKRRKLARALLERGRLDELAVQLEILLTADERDAAAHLLMGHLHVARAALEEQDANLTAALASYEQALTIELAAGDDELLLRNVAAVFNNTVVAKKARRKLITTADTLIEKYLRTRATEALLKQLNQPNTSKEARDWLQQRITKLGAEANVDRVKFIIQDLSVSQCATAAEQTATEAIIDRLKSEGASDPRAVGALLRYALQHNRCEKMAINGVQRILGERVGFLSRDDVAITEALVELKSASCRTTSSRATAEDLLKRLVRLNDRRVIGPLLRFASMDAACRDAALRTAESILGERVVFESRKEARFAIVLADLTNQRCTSSGRQAMLKAITAIGNERDPRAIGQLLRIAADGNACSDAALSTARKLINLKGLATSCVDADIETLKTIPCKGSSNIARVDKAMSGIAKDKNLAGVGPLLRLAAEGGPCGKPALMYAQRALENEQLALGCPEPECPAAAPAQETPKPKSTSKKRRRRKRR